MQKPIEYFSTLRGLLAFWVLMGHMLVVEHYHSIYNAGFATHTDFGTLGKLSFLHFLAVDIFFMISGYTLTQRYADSFTKATKGKEIDRFYLKRLIRIWPLHALMVAWIGLYQYLGVPHPISSGLEKVIFEHWEWTLFVNLLLMNGWGMIPVSSWNEPAWTLSVTFFLYVLFPNLVLILKRISASARINLGLIFFFILGYMVLRNLVPLGSQSDGAGGLLRGLVFFLCGILLARIPTLPRMAWGIAPFVIAILGWTFIHPFPLWVIHLTYPFLLIGIIQSPTSVLPEQVSQWMGEVSFALFLSHYPLLLLLHYVAGDWFIQMAAGGAAGKLLCYGIAVGLCLLVADLLRRLDGRMHNRRRLNG